MFVAAQGPLFSEGGDRGIYKTTDGGNSWDRVHHVNDDTGFTSIEFDAKNPDIMIAGTYQRRRHVGQMIGGGPDGGLFRSTNAGKTWTKVTKGLPTGEVGRIALAVDPKKPGRMYALIDGKCAAPECGGGRGGGGGAAGGAFAGRAGGAGAAGRGGADAPPPAPAAASASTRHRSLLQRPMTAADSTCRTTAASRGNASTATVAADLPTTRRSSLTPTSRTRSGR